MLINLFLDSQVDLLLAVWRVAALLSPGRLTKLAEVFAPEAQIPRIEILNPRDPLHLVRAHEVGVLENRILVHLHHCPDANCLL